MPDVKRKTGGDRPIAEGTDKSTPKGCLIAVCSTICEMLREGVFLIPAKGEVHCNSALRELLEIEHRRPTLSMIRSRLETRLSASERKLLKNHLNGLPGEMLLSLKLPSGTLRNLHLAVNVCSSPLGSVVCCIVQETLSSGDTNPEQTLRLLNAVFDGIEDGILILQPGTMVIQRANAAAARLLAIGTDQITDKKATDFLVKSNKGLELAAQISTKLPILKYIHLDLEMRRSNGTTFPALLGVSEITNGLGEPLAWIWIITDMTQRIYLNQARIDFEMRYRLLFDRTADPILIIDANSRKIIDSNAAAESQLGYPHSQLVGLTMDDVTPPSRRSKMNLDFNSLTLGGTTAFDGVNLDSSGNEIPVQISLVATDFEGRKVFIASCRDISQQKSLERERLRVEKLDAARKMAGGLAHELSQPLQGLTTIADLLQQSGLSEDERLRLVEKIAPEVERMVALLDQMKRIVRLEMKPYTGSDDILDIRQSTTDILSDASG